MGTKVVEDGRDKTHGSDGALLRIGVGGAYHDALCPKPLRETSMGTVQNPLLMDVPMPIRTPRLLLRPKQPGDGIATVAAVSDRLPAFVCGVVPQD